MIWDGETVYTVQEFKPITTPAIKWTIKSDGNYTASDRGTTEDIFESVVKFQGPIAELTTLETVLNDNRIVFTATFGTGEEIFGMDVDYSGSLSVTVVSYGKIQKVDFKVFEMPLRLRLLSSPSFIGTGSISDLRKSSHQDTRESINGILKNFTYDNDIFTNDRFSSSKQGAGTYSANFTQTNDEMKSIRRYLLSTKRADSFTMPSFDDMDYPFGTTAGTGPFTVRAIGWSDGGRLSPVDWDLSLTLARVF